MIFGYYSTLRFIVVSLLLNTCLVHSWKAPHSNRSLVLYGGHRGHIQSSIQAQRGGYTVYGLSSAIPDGGCGVAITRISGDQSLRVLELLTTNRTQHEEGIRGEFQCYDRMATLRSIYTHSNDEPIDKAITIYFKAPNSFTGEDVVEIHTHGSKAIVAHLFDALRHFSTEHGLLLRQAERGEFTRRAFYNGKLDLTQAEALRDVIGAETRLSMQNAVLKLRGGLTNLYTSWAEKLRKALALVEAKIDFEEQASTDIQIAKHEAEDIKAHLIQLLSEIKDKIEDEKGELLSSSMSVAFVGPPNAGKSTLLNTICNRDVAIVADLPGTTRDIIQVPYDLYGIKANIIDTAGIRIPTNGSHDDPHWEIENVGIHRALERINDVDLAVFLYDHTNACSSQTSLDIVRQHIPPDCILIVCVSKGDLLDGNRVSDVMEEIRISNPDIRHPILLISTSKMDSVDRLMNAINKYAKDKLPVIKAEPLITDARHKSHLGRVVHEIQNALTTLSGQQPDLEIIAENMREAITQVAYIVGEQTNEEILDEIFNTFCIGK